MESYRRDVAIDSNSTTPRQTTTPRQVSEDEAVVDSGTPTPRQSRGSEPSSPVRIDPSSTAPRASHFESAAPVCSERVSATVETV